MYWLSEFIEVGKALYDQGLNHASSGNLSVRKGDDLYITATGRRLGDLTFDDILRVNLNDARKDKGASVEVGVHRAILRNTKHLAVVHAHPIWCTALSLIKDSIVPQDAEGFFYMPSIPVLDLRERIGSEEMAEKVPGYLIQYPVVVVKGHGSFAAAADLRTAEKYTAVLEKSCQIMMLAAISKGFLA